MQLSEYIKGLKKFMKENGDMEAFFASDDEGNSYQAVSYTGTQMLKLVNDKQYKPELYCLADRDEFEDEEMQSVCVIN